MNRQNKMIHLSSIDGHLLIYTQINNIQQTSHFTQVEQFKDLYPQDEIFYFHLISRGLVHEFTFECLCVSNPTEFKAIVRVINSSDPLNIRVELMGVPFMCFKEIQESSSTNPEIDLCCRPMTSFQERKAIRCDSHGRKCPAYGCFTD